MPRYELLLAKHGAQIRMPSLKIVYVLCTDQIDYLYLLAANATLAEVAAPELEKVCVMDRRTYKFASACGFRFSDWIETLTVVEASEATPLLNSRFLKTSLRTLVQGDFLFLDIDAILANRELIGHLDCPCVGAAQNLDHLRVVPGFPEEIGRTVYQPMGWEHPFLPYANTGVLFCRDNPASHRFFGTWHRLWKEQTRRLGICLDQPSFNRVVWEHPECLTVMPRAFNAAVDVDPEFETGAWVYHYYISIYSGKARRDSLLGIVAREIQRRGQIHTATLRFLVKQRRAFIPEAYKLLHAIKQGLWRHAYYVCLDGAATVNPTQAMQPFPFRAGATDRKA
jgi:hypothetical protein